MGHEEQVADTDAEREDGGESGHEEDAPEPNAVEEAAPEDSAARPLRDPGQPTRQERLHHELAHRPLRPGAPTVSQDVLRITPIGADASVRMARASRRCRWTTGSLQHLTAASRAQCWS